jgi:hypothetical protein
MSKHRNPRPRLSKQPPADNLAPDLDNLVHLLRDNLGKADAFITAAERVIEESWSGGDDDQAEADEYETGDSALRRRSRAEHLIEAGKLAVRAAAYTTEEIDRRRSGA